jgi:hypothetical protein
VTWYDKAPNVEKLAEPEWSCWVPGRTPEYKVQKLGMAKAALSDVHGSTGKCRGGVLYRYITGIGWRVIAKIEPGSSPTLHALFNDWDNFRLNPPFHEFVIEEHP